MRLAASQGMRCNPQAGHAADGDKGMQASHVRPTVLETKSTV
jgi:hypothetical protein